MLGYILKIKETLLTSIGCQVENERPVYSLCFVIPINILSEVSFILNTYLIRPVISFLKVFIGRRPSAVGLYGAIISILVLHPLVIVDKNSFYIIVGLIHLLAYFATKSVLVIKNTQFSGLFLLNKLITSLLLTVGTSFIIFMITKYDTGPSFTASVLITFIISLFGWKFRASIGRRSSFLMIASALLFPVTPFYYLVGSTSTIILVLIPAIYKFYKEDKKTGASNYTHRDLEVMKLFGQASASGYAFEERLIPVLDSLGYDTKFAKWYKDRKEYPPEYLNKSGAGDGGLDLIGTSVDNIMLCQCKFYNSNVTAAVVSQLCTSKKIFERWYRSKGDYRRVSLMIVTNAGFDSTARANAKEEEVILVDGDALKKMFASGKLDLKKIA